MNRRNSVSTLEKERKMSGIRLVRTMRLHGDWWKEKTRRQWDSWRADLHVGVGVREIRAFSSFATANDDLHHPQGIKSLSSMMFDR